MNEVFSYISTFFAVLRLADIIDIAIVALVFYYLSNLIREARVWQILKGVIFFLLATWISGILHLNAVNFILVNTMQVGILALVILFQPELRRLLQQIGKTNFESFFKGEKVDNVKTASEITKAVCALSRARLGALIVIEGKTGLGDIFGTGTELNATVTSDLLITIFFNKTPLHDGAVVINDNTIRYAACVLPLTRDESLSRELGTRHRAAIGLSENCDASVIVVSEETGIISIAQNGKLTRNFSEPELLEAVTKILRGDEVIDEDKSKIHNKWKEIINVRKN
ncbi:MAG: diadenylate cyclase CdaA [Clostridia bacterium]|nr:diadenylate cyclase CdaA [Clostridia bacterium]